jgi:uncharacterized protein YecE (DUF72 family)
MPGCSRRYAAQLDTVEVNNTFYRMPKRAALATWASQVPDTFRFAIKAPQRITHVERLTPSTGESDSVACLFRNLEALGDKLGVVLFQSPPNLKEDLPRLQAFLARLPGGRAAQLRVSARDLERPRSPRWLARACCGAVHCRGRGR